MYHGSGDDGKQGPSEVAGGTGGGMEGREDLHSTSLTRTALDGGLVERRRADVREIRRRDGMDAMASRGENEASCEEEGKTEAIYTCVDAWVLWCFGASWVRDGA